MGQTFVPKCVVNIHMWKCSVPCETAEDIHIDISQFGLNRSYVFFSFFIFQCTSIVSHF